MKVTKGYTFDDVLLVPKYSNITSRSNIDTSVQLPRGIKLSIPIISANMKTVTGPDMAYKIAKLGGIGLIHRFVDSPYLYLDLYNSAIGNRSEHSNHEYFSSIRGDVCEQLDVYDRVGVSIGVNNKEWEPLKTIIRKGCKIVCVDVAHGDTKTCIDTIKQLRKEYSHILIIAGNVATPQATLRLADAGADVIKCGIGGGSLCSTRIETGNGVPQLSALENIFSNSDIPIIADGGLRSAGDICKALCFSDLVMLGSILAGTDEAPGEVVTNNGQQYKIYAGSSTHKTNHIEGVVGLVPYKGAVDNVISKLMEGLRSGMSYQGANNLKELKFDPEFVSISHAGLIESHPHDVLLGNK